MGDVSISRGAASDAEICLKIAAELRWMAVRESEAGRGIGMMMLNDVCAGLRSRGIRMVAVKTLAPTVDYPPYALTRRFYQKAGFVLVEIIDPYPGWDPGNPCAVYVKAL